MERFIGLLGILAILGIAYFMSNNKKEIDPICKMVVDPENAADKFEFDGGMYYFCCSGCKEKFALEPSSYIN